MNKFARFYLEKLGRVAWADRVEGMSPENQQRLADSLPENKTRMTGPLGRGAEGTAVKSFTGGGVGPTVTKRFFNTQSGSGTPGNIADKIDLFDRYPQLFPKIHHGIKGGAGYSMERLNPWPGPPTDSETRRPVGQRRHISPQVPISPGTPVPSLKNLYDSARPLSASPVPNIGNTTAGPSLALRGAGGQLFEVSDIRRSNVGIDASGNTKVFDPQITRISQGQYPMPLSGGLPNATPVIRRLALAPAGQPQNWGFAPGMEPAAPVPAAAPAPSRPSPILRREVPTVPKPTFASKAAPAGRVGGAIVANLLGGKVVDSVLPAKSPGDGFQDQLANNLRDTGVAMGGGALGGGAAGGARGALVGAIGGGIGDLTNKALTLGKTVRNTDWKYLVGNPEAGKVDPLARRPPRVAWRSEGHARDLAKYKEKNPLPQSSNLGNSSSFP